MKIKSVVTVLFLCILTQNVLSQYVMEINGEKVTTEEFKRLYLKNNTSTSKFSKSDITEYIDLFSLFKMKLLEAKSKRLDTLTSVKNDYIKYTDQLAVNTLSDKNYEQKLIEKMYNYLKYDVKVAHIMVKVTGNNAKDTLAAYNKIKYLRSITTAANFYEKAKENSEDKATAVKGGEIGYITGFTTLPIFEEYAFQTPVGEVSDFFRSQFGYHFIKVLDKRPAIGRIKVAHIYKSGDDAEKELNKAYKELKTGSISFDEAVAKYSDDAATKKNNGKLPEFGVSQMVPEFEKEAYALNMPNDISKPFDTKYGWHIIRLIEKTGIKSKSEMEGEIVKRIKQHPSYKDKNERVFDDISDKYKVMKVRINLDPYISGIDKDFFKKTNWKLPSATRKTDLLILNVAKKSYVVSDFISYVNENYIGVNATNSSEFINVMFEKFCDRKIMDIVKVDLAKEDQEFANLQNDYKNGLMIFEIMEQEVWKKSSNDTMGLKKLYEKEKMNYLYKPRLKVETITYSEEQKAKDALEFVKKEKGLKGLSEDIQIYLYEKGSDVQYPNLKWQKGHASISKVGNQYVVMNVLDILQPSPKTFTDVRGKLQSQYQKIIEGNWNNSMRRKYKVTLNQAELDKLIK